ncbi:DUF4440 domain-containing protein [Roseobacteraceae bacterium NS-SX3]
MSSKILTNGPFLAEILDLEAKVWAALAAGDAAADARMLTGDFLGVYPSGYSDRDGHCAQLEGGPAVERYSLSDARLRVISDRAVLLTYTAAYRRPGARQGETMFVSSLWEKTAKGWRSSFSQDTPKHPQADPGTSP